MRRRGIRQTNDCPRRLLQSAKIAHLHKSNKKKEDFFKCQYIHNESTEHRFTAKMCHTVPQQGRRNTPELPKSNLTAQPARPRKTMPRRWQNETIASLKTAKLSHRKCTAQPAKQENRKPDGGKTDGRMRPNGYSITAKNNVTGRQKDIKKPLSRR